MASINIHIFMSTLFFSRLRSHCLEEHLPLQVETYQISNTPVKVGGWGSWTGICAAQPTRKKHDVEALKAVSGYIPHVTVIPTALLQSICGIQCYLAARIRDNTSNIFVPSFHEPQPAPVPLQARPQMRSQNY